MSARSVACIYKNTNNVYEFLPAFTQIQNISIRLVISSIT